MVKLSAFRSLAGDLDHDGRLISVQVVCGVEVMDNRLDGGRDGGMSAGLGVMVERDHLADAGDVTEGDVDLVPEVALFRVTDDDVNTPSVGHSIGLCASPDRLANQVLLFFSVHLGSFSLEVPIPHPRDCQDDREPDRREEHPRDRPQLAALTIVVPGEQLTQA